MVTTNKKTTDILLLLVQCMEKVTPLMWQCFQQMCNLSLIMRQTQIETFYKISNQDSSKCQDHERQERMGEVLKMRRD